MRRQRREGSSHFEIPIVLVARIIANLRAAVQRPFLAAWRHYRIATYGKTGKPGDPTIVAGNNRPTRQPTTAHHSATADDLLKVNFGQGFSLPCLEPMAAAIRLCAATSWSSVVATSHKRACSSIWRL